MRKGDFDFYPSAGINTEADDGSMVPSDKRFGRRVFYRDIVNMRVTDAGELELRPGVSLATATQYKYLWQSPRYGSVFAVLDGQLGLLNSEWAFAALGYVGTDVEYLDLNEAVLIAGSAGVFSFNGAALATFTIVTPPAPQVAPSQGGLVDSTYGVAISFRVGDKESALSEAVFLNTSGGVSVSLPDPSFLEPAATHISLYMTAAGGGELYLHSTVPVGTYNVVLDSIPTGKLATNRFLDPMPTGRGFRYWRGRLICARGDTIYASEPLNYHLHDRRFGFVQLPARITFIEAVSGGIWVGMTDRVVFLRGDSFDKMEVVDTTAQPPVPWSSTLIESDLLGGDDTNSEGLVACWFARNGYVLGLSSGAITEVSKGVLNGVSGVRGQTVTHNRFLLTVTS